MSRFAVLLAVFFLVGAVHLSGFAEAGDKKLNFGYPLGNFTAKSHSGGSSGSSYSDQQRRKAAARKAAARRAAARKAKARKAAARKAAERKAAERRAKAKAAIASKDSGSSANKDQDDASDKRAPVRASAIAGTNTLDLRKPENRDDEGKDGSIDVVDAKSKQPALVDRSSPAEDSDDGRTCKKYVPSAGMTISVPC